METKSQDTTQSDHTVKKTHCTIYIKHTRTHTRARKQQNTTPPHKQEQTRARKHRTNHHHTTKKPHTANTIHVTTQRDTKSSVSSRTLQHEFAEDGRVSARCRTVPPTSTELSLAFSDAHLGATHDAHHDVRESATQQPLTTQDTIDDVIDITVTCMIKCIQMTISIIRFICNTSQCKLRSTFRNLRVTNVICIVTYYTLPPLESPDSFWMTRSQRFRRHTCFV